MITKVMPIEELVQIFTEELLNHTNKVTKVSDESIVNGVSFGCAKVGQKAMKEIALVESHILPESAFGSNLDKIAIRLGISPRFDELGSSTYLRLVGSPGTVYTNTTHFFKSSSGITFELTNSVTLPADGFTYALVRSIETGSKSNVDPLSINIVSPLPIGHKYLINEARPVGGRDLESDELFLRRIKEGPNLLAKNTLSYLDQVCNKVDSNILKTLYQGSDSNGKNLISVVTQNGVALSNNELSTLLTKISPFLSLTDLQPYDENYVGVTLENSTWFPVDISMRLELDPTFNPDEVRKEIQIRILKYLDFRTWSNEDKVEWDKILLLVTTTKGVKYVADEFFFPQVDLEVPKNTLPRLRGFLMLDLDGNILQNISGTLNPVFYPTNPDFSFQATVLSSIV